MKHVINTCAFVGFAATASLAQALTLAIPPVVAGPSGEAVFQHWCAPCHAAGPGHPGTESLQRKYEGKLPATLLDRSDLAPETVATFVRQGVLMMAPFRKTEITDAELAALAAFVAKNHRKAK
jgi:mono/diheme cytochrome c family protein